MNEHAAGSIHSRPFLIATICAAMFVGLAAWTELSNWQTQVSRINSYLEQTAKAIAQHTDDVIEVAKQPLVGLVLQVRNNNDTMLQKLELMRTMREVTRNSPYLRSLAYLGADGRLIESTTNVFSAGVDLSDRAYFIHHQHSEDLSPRADGPFKGPVTNEWFMTLSQRLNDREGHFAGVMVATIDIRMFVNFFKGFSFPGEATLAMIDGDGRLLVRSPMDESALGTNLSQTPFYRDALLAKGSGNYPYRSPFDGVFKQSGYYTSQATHIAVLVAIPQKDILWYWVTVSKTRWLFSLAAICAALAMALRLRHNMAMARRNQLMIAARDAEFQLIANASSDLIEKLDDNGLREYVSAASRSVLEVDPGDIVGKSVLDGYDAEVKQYWSEALANIAAGSSIERLVFRRTRKSGETAWLETVITRVRHFDVGGGMVAITRDVTSQRLLQEELDRLANTDELTQLSNKRHFNAQLRLRTAEARANGQPFSLLLMDVDRFKLFNDTYGHLPGDTCLRRIAAEISTSIRPGMDLAARYGGEEIAVLLPGLGEDEAWDRADMIRQRIAALEIEHAKNLPWACVTVSIGVATLAVEQNESDEALIVRADQALYQAKNSGRNTVLGGQGRVTE
ncbi:diguanylate cyclase [Allorhizobium terrae]|uniref:diguanylate cyclase n=2 Tax=Allorhizobium terrae TaxID=1848972 RepID=A0A4S4A5R1_9HYPH|nr:diguanylate cyclase [Allorhizobium terrae]